MADGETAAIVRRHDIKSRQRSRRSHKDTSSRGTDRVTQTELETAANANADRDRDRDYRRRGEKCARNNKKTESQSVGATEIGRD